VSLVIDHVEFLCSPCSLRKRLGEFHAVALELKRTWTFTTFC
jgi:hypothetical protein